MSNSFVKRAPEIAEEILLKVADSRLPADLKAFSKGLLSKEASDDREKLIAPSRMSLAELQKIAHSNGTSLPVVNVTNVDDWADTAAGLTKIATRHEAENAREILENATAMVATKKASATGALAEEATTAARHAANPAVGGVVPKFHGALARFGNAAKQREHQLATDIHAAGRANITGTTENAAAQSAASMKSKATDDAASAARGHDLKEKAITHTAPLMAAAVGVPMAAMAMRRDSPKKEDVRIYK